MTHVVPVFPSGTFTWTDRVDNVNVDFANDINSVASEIISTETTLGVNPQVEKSPPNKNQSKITYSSVDARISDAMGGVQLPICVLRTTNPFSVPNSSSGLLTNFTFSYDPYGFYNGTDITINTTGWYFITSHNQWNWWDNGYSHNFISLSGNLVDQDVIDWNTSWNTGSGIPRWQKFGKRSRITHLVWQGTLSVGERVSVFSENGTSNSGLEITYSALHLSMLKMNPTSAPAV